MFVPRSDVTYLRDNCRDDSRFPNPQDATPEQFDSVLYLSETGWGSAVPDGMACVVTIDDLKSYFDSWDQYSDYCEMYFGGRKTTDSERAFKEDSLRYLTVYDWLRDSVDQGFHPVTVKGE